MRADVERTLERWREPSSAQLRDADGELLARVDPEDAAAASRVVIPSASSRAICSSCGVRSSSVVASRRRAVSTVAASSTRACSAHGFRAEPFERDERPRSRSRARTRFRSAPQAHSERQPCPSRREHVRCPLVQPERLDEALPASSEASQAEHHRRTQLAGALGGAMRHNDLGMQRWNLTGSHEPERSVRGCWVLHA